MPEFCPIHLLQARRSTVRRLGRGGATGAGNAEQALRVLPEYFAELRRVTFAEGAEQLPKVSTLLIEQRDSERQPEVIASARWVFGAVDTVVFRIRADRAVVAYFADEVSLRLHGQLTRARGRRLEQLVSCRRFRPVVAFISLRLSLHGSALATARCADRASPL